MRDIDEADVPSIPDTKGEREGLKKLEYTIELITPMFGGGHEAGEIETDPEMVIRGSTIRGHLRFWWRATRGTKCLNWVELSQKEHEIWGSTTHPSQIQIEVIVKTKTIQEDNILLDQNNSYVLFPYRQNAVNRRVKSLTKLSFTLKVTFPSGFVNDVEAAVWAWTNFGGIGARTRRGCGSLFCKKTAPPTSRDIGDWYKEKMSEFEINCDYDENRPCPSLPSSLVVWNNRPMEPLEVWYNLNGLFQDFRQGTNIARDAGHNRPGRSWWPEPESLRNAIMEQHNYKNRPDNWHGPDSRIKSSGFPRAEFGMPIIFDIRGEGIKLTLQPDEKIERMASPIILRPIMSQDGSVASIIIKLNTSVLKSAIVIPQGKNKSSDLLSNYRVSEDEIRDSELPQSRFSTLYKRTKSGSALEAFISYAKEQGFIEVGL